ncbi:hypothetical protein ACHAXT_009108 [Thalassiosira profunda]
MGRTRARERRRSLAPPEKGVPSKEATVTASKFSCSEWAVGYVLACCPDLFGCSTGTRDDDTVATWESNPSADATTNALSLQLAGEEDATPEEVELARSLSFVDQVLYRIENEAMIGEVEDDDDVTGSSYTTSAYDSELSASGATSSELSDRKDITGSGQEDSRPAEKSDLDDCKNGSGGGQGNSRPAERSRRERLLHAQRVRRKERLARSRSCPGAVGNDSAGTADVRTWSSGTMRYMMV